MTDEMTIDCRGLDCPQPVINTRDALAGATANLLVIVDNEGSCTNVTRVAESQGARVEVAREGADYHLTIEPGHVAPAEEESTIEGTTSGKGSMVVYVASEGMGRGDEELGAILMAAFLDTLSQFKGELSHAVFVNAGARLAVEGSPVLEQLRQLEQIGARVLVCGTCLNHFGITDRLAVGNVSNMFEIIETLSRADRIVSP